MVLATANVLIFRASNSTAPRKSFFIAIPVVLRLEHWSTAISRGGRGERLLELKYYLRGKLKKRIDQMDHGERHDGHWREKLVEVLC